MRMPVLTASAMFLAALFSIQIQSQTGWTSVEVSDAEAAKMFGAMGTVYDAGGCGDKACPDENMVYSSCPAAEYWVPGGSYPGAAGSPFYTDPTCSECGMQCGATAPFSDQFGG